MTVVADVYVGDVLAATLTALEGGITQFAYTSHALENNGPVVASTLPLSAEPVLTAGGALPAFFANLLPEGRRLSTLKRAAKASLDDELALLLAVGSNTVGNVSVVPAGRTPDPSVAQIDMTADLDFTTVLTAAGVNDPAALAGAQDKASARTIAVPVGGVSQSFILKVSPPEYPFLVENEAACYEIARRLPSAWLRLAEVEVIHDKFGRSGLLVTRFDRAGSHRYPVEDAAQLLNLHPGQKYSTTMEEIVKAVCAVVVSPTRAKRTIALMVALAWLTGNGDMHAKNISVIDTGAGYDVAPVYDIPSTLVYGDSTLALPVQGAKDNISAKKFLAFTDDIGLPRAVGERIIARALTVTEDAAEIILDSGRFDARRSRDVRRVLARRRRLFTTSA
ncbi:type II toxin-antitoxin system HipA family toxin [Corynebacterium uterequi]|uniref:HipA domain-containing protein n=1 Tax=Corynebacterium uterequi TaxID=1072256 RepID=A0A0G3HHR0_9CORY|nr:HipA domain-containing protein [Corynebacterium uterequi]AKK10667.1 HipA domain-containing protein [Corynebacterium uterequi]